MPVTWYINIITDFSNIINRLFFYLKPMFRRLPSVPALRWMQRGIMIYIFTNYREIFHNTSYLLSASSSLLQFREKFERAWTVKWCDHELWIWEAAEGIDCGLDTGKLAFTFINWAKQRLDTKPSNREPMNSWIYGRFSNYSVVTFSKLTEVK
jgi:hypothetical protein